VSDLKGFLHSHEGKRETVSATVMEKVSATVLAGQADYGVCHGWRFLSMALRMTGSLRMAAVSASFLALPAATRRG
jgi:hypothetical protein